MLKRKGSCFYVAVVLEHKLPDYNGRLRDEWVVRFEDHGKVSLVTKAQEATAFVLQTSAEHYIRKTNWRGQKFKLLTSPNIISGPRYEYNDNENIW